MRYRPKRAWSSNSEELFEIATKMQNDPKTKELILNQMKKVKDKHTYVSRLNDIIVASEM